MTVLLVDDNEINLEIQKYMLESCELTVDTADSGEKAIELASSKSYDMIFMDIQMPEMDGFTASERIRQFNGTVPIIALSADKVKYRDERFLSAGMNGSIEKPLRQNVLNELLSSYLHTGEKADIQPQNTDVIFDSEGFSALVSEPVAEIQILEQFLSIHDKDCEILKERIAAGNILGARELMHDIVGISGNLYCHRLFYAATELGAELRQGFSDSLDRFTEVWYATIAELKEYCGKLVADTTDGEEESVDWNVLWQDFYALCDEFDVAAVKLFRRNIRVFSENLSETNFRRLSSAVEQYDFLAIIDDKEGFDV